VNKATSQALTDFSLSCQKYFVCYTFSDFGLQEYAKNLASHSRNHDKTLIVGTGHPDEKRWHATLRIGEAINSSQANGVFSDKIAKAFEPSGKRQSSISSARAVVHQTKAWQRV
jgi:hypothetical protein